MTKTKRSPRRLSEADARRIAVAADCDPRTVQKYLTDPASVRPMTAKRIAAAFAREKGRLS